MAIQLCISGASGRVGTLLLQLLPEFPEYTLCGAIVAPGSETIGTACSVGSDSNGARRNTSIIFTDNHSHALQEASALINFSTPAASLAALRIASARGVASLIATTGHSSEEREEIQQLAKKAPVLLASNTSTSVFVLQELALRAQELMGSDFDIEIAELHHRHKKDAPSGTALSLAELLATQRDSQIVTTRSGANSPRSIREIGVAALRGGDAPGEHTVYFLGEGERLEITQRARDRSIFARGALRLMRHLYTKPAGLYSVKTLFTQ